MNLIEISSELGKRLLERGWHVTTAESCTGGGVSAALTAVPGSSAWFGYGFVTYANAAKIKLLQVPAEILEREGAVSETVVIAMAKGALQTSGADLSVAISGIAGPDGGSTEKPVGTVWFAWATKDGFSRSEKCRFEGDRSEVQRHAVLRALEGVLDMLRVTEGAV